MGGVGGNPHHPTEQPTETIKPVGVCNDINFNNILNRRPASSASNADKNRGHRIDCLLCQITGNNDAEMGVEGDLTAVYSTEYITTGNTDGERGRKVILRRDTVQGT